MAVLNEEIGKIEAGSNLDKLYNRLLSGFLKAQDDTLPDYTSDEYVTQEVNEDGYLVYVADEEKIKASIEEQKLIAMKNSAYLFATSMLGTDAGGGSGGGSGSGGSGGMFVSIAGDYMTGKLSTLFGLSAGDNGIKILDVYQTAEENAEDRTSMVRINGQLHLDPYGLFINDRNVMSFSDDVLTLTGPLIRFVGDVECDGSFTVGNTTIDGDGIHIGSDDGDFEFYHSGNANREDVDWKMRNGTVAGKLLVKGDTEIQGGITALHGGSFGFDDREVLVIDDRFLVKLNADLDMTGGLMIQGEKVLYLKNPEVISLSAPNKILNLGDDETSKIDLQTGIYDDDGEYQLVGKFGDAYFPNSFRAGHLLGNVLIETYKNDTEDAGVMVSRWLKFHDFFGPGLNSDGDNLQFKAPFRYIVTDGEESNQITEYRTAVLQFKESTSLFAPLNRKSASLTVTTDADFYVFDKPIEGKTSIGISDSKTRLLHNQLFFDDSVYWQGLSDGVKYYGNAYMVNNIGSVEFSSGFAGSGWQIYKNLLTGNVSATFDELTVRKKMRVYELEVQKQSVTNGSLWVSDACSGDLVEEIA
jgi:hypothetical protein